ncbi:hypothetical protein NC651_008902 [Populus alba x Populus x berolinensis]|nr:hypothetical protein NC651_008902 [Populus alba x Populus x berolinensis]
MFKLEHISDYGVNMVLCFYQVLVVLCLFGTAETGCALARTFELLLILGMVKKKKKDFAAFDQGWRFTKW